MALSFKERDRAFNAAYRKFKDTGEAISVQAILKECGLNPTPQNRQTLASILDHNNIRRLGKGEKCKSVAEYQKPKPKPLSPKEKVIVDKMAETVSKGQPKTLAETPMHLDSPFELVVKPTLKEKLNEIISFFDVELELARLARNGNKKAFNILMELIQE